MSALDHEEYRICVPLTHYLALYRIAAVADFVNPNRLPVELRNGERCGKVVEYARRRIERSLSR